MICFVSKQLWSLNAECGWSCEHYWYWLNWLCVSKRPRSHRRTHSIIRRRDVVESSWTGLQRVEAGCCRRQLVAQVNWTQGADGLAVEGLGWTQRMVRSTTVLRVNLVYAAARLVLGLSPRDHVCPSLLGLHRLPVYYRIQFKLGLLMYVAHNGQGVEICTIEFLG